jgi:hypothetical protein
MFPSRTHAKQLFLPGLFLAVRPAFNAGSIPCLKKCFSTSAQGLQQSTVNISQ